MPPTDELEIAPAVANTTRPGGIVAIVDDDPHISRALGMWLELHSLRDEERLRYGSPPSGIRCLKKPFDLDALEDALFPLLN